MHSNILCRTCYENQQEEHDTIEINDLTNKDIEENPNNYIFYIEI